MMNKLTRSAIHQLILAALFFTSAPNNLAAQETCKREVQEILPFENYNELPEDAAPMVPVKRKCPRKGPPLKMPVKRDISMGYTETDHMITRYEIEDIDGTILRAYILEDKGIWITNPETLEYLDGLVEEERCAGNIK